MDSESWLRWLRMASALPSRSRRCASMTRAWSTRAGSSPLATAAVADDVRLLPQAGGPDAHAALSFRGAGWCGATAAAAASRRVDREALVETSEQPARTRPVGTSQEGRVDGSEGVARRHAAALAGAVDEILPGVAAAGVLLASAGGQVRQEQALRLGQAAEVLGQRLLHGHLVALRREVGEPGPGHGGALLKDGQLGVVQRRTLLRR